MAKVIGTYGLIKGVEPEDYYKYPHHMQDYALDAIPKDRILRFSVGDGYALYYVQSIEHAILLHIPYGDQWKEDEIILEALTPDSIRQLLQREKRLYELLDKLTDPNPPKKKKKRKEEDDDAE